MTLSYAYTCDVCGTSEHIPIDEDPNKLPTGWAHITVDYPDGMHQAKHLCTSCTQAMQDDVPIAYHALARSMAIPWRQGGRA